MIENLRWILIPWGVTLLEVDHYQIRDKPLPGGCYQIEGPLSWGFTRLEDLYQIRDRPLPWGLTILEMDLYPQALPEWRWTFTLGGGLPYSWGSFALFYILLKNYVLCLKYFFQLFTPCYCPVLWPWCESLSLSMLSSCIVLPSAGINHIFAFISHFSLCTNLQS